MGLPDEEAVESTAPSSTPWYKTKKGKIGLACGGVAVVALAIGLGVGIPMASQSADSDSVVQDPTTADTNATMNPAPPPPLPPTVVGVTRNIISEVFASPDDIVIPAPSANYTTCGEQYSGVGATFIELYNPSGADMDMSGYLLRTASNVTFRFPIPTTFKADSYIVLRHRLWDGPAAQYTFDGTLDQNNDTVIIEDGSGAVVDQLTFTDMYPWPEGAGKDDTSLERVLYTRATDAPANWRASKVKGGTPGRANSVAGQGGISYIRALDLAPQAPTSSDSVTVTVTVDSPIAVRAVSLWYEVADRPAEQVTILPMAVADGKATATIPAQPSGSLVRFKFAVEYSNDYKDVVPFNDDLYPFRSYFVYDTPPGQEDQNHIWLFGYARTRKGEAPVSRLTSPARPISGCVIKLGTAAPAVYDGAEVKLSKQNNYKVKFLPSNRFPKATKIKIAPESLTNPDWGIKFSPMIEYMGFQFFTRLGGVATPWSELFTIHWGQGTAPTVQAVIQEVNDGMLNQNGLPDGEPLLKASYADNNPALDSCYEATENAPLPGNRTFFNDADLFQRFSVATTYAELQTKVNTTSFAAFVAGSVMLANWDGFWNNHFISISPVDGRMIAVPWDFDHVFGYVEVSVPEEYRSGFPFTYPAGNKVTWNPYFGTNRIFEELCENADFQNEVLAKVNEALAANVFVDFAAFVDATADRMTAMVTAAGQTGAAATISECRDKTKRYLARTKTYLEGQVARGNAAFYT